MRLLDKPTARTSDAWFANQTDAFFVSSFSQHLQFLPLLGGGNVTHQPPNYELCITHYALRIKKAPLQVER